MNAALIVFFACRTSASPASEVQQTRASPRPIRAGLSVTVRAVAPVHVEQFLGSIWFAAPTHYVVLGELELPQGDA
jgi:hypothetical protein